VLKIMAKTLEVYFMAVMDQFRGHDACHTGIKEPIVGEYRFNLNRVYYEQNVFYWSTRHIL
jgi:hypothetical protein